MGADQIKELIISTLHSIHDDTLHMMQQLENLLKLFGEDMSWYEEYREKKEKIGEKNIF